MQTSCSIEAASDKSDDFPSSQCCSSSSSSTFSVSGGLPEFVPTSESSISSVVVIGLADTQVESHDDVKMMSMALF